MTVWRKCTSQAHSGFVRILFPDCMNSGFVYKDLLLPDSFRKKFGGAQSVPILQFYSVLYPHASKDTWEQKIRSGLVSKNGNLVEDPAETVSAGDRLEYLRPPWVEPSIPTDSTPITYLHCDNDVAVISKPTEVPCLPGGLYYENTVLMLLKKQTDPLQNLDALNAPVHRLGRGTTGALVLARTASARRFLMKAFQDHLVEKTYLAIMQGVVSQDQFDVTQPIGKVPYRLCKLSGFLWSASDSKDAKPSFSSFTVLARDEDKKMTLCKVRITTGRPHQIRIHSAFAGHPLVGDPLYLPGGLPDEKIIAESVNTTQISDDAVTDDDESARDGSLPGDCGYFLHSWKVRIPHPSSSGHVDITCPPPPAFQATFPLPADVS